MKRTLFLCILATMLLIPKSLIAEEAGWEWWWAKYQEAGHHNPKWDSFVREGIWHWDANNWDKGRRAALRESVDACRKALHLGCDCPIVKFIYARNRYMLEGPTPEIRKYLEESIEAASRDKSLGLIQFSSTNILGWQYFQMGEHAKAKEYFEKALAIESGDIDDSSRKDARDGLDRAQYALERVRKTTEEEEARRALATAKKRIQDGAEDLPILLDAASLSLKVGTATEALEYSQKAIALAPDDPKAILAHVRVLNELKNARAVEHHASQGIALALQAGDEATTAGILDVYSCAFEEAMKVDRGEATLSDKEMAVPVGRKVVSVYPDNPVAVRAYVRILRGFSRGAGGRWVEIRRVSPRGIIAAHKQELWLVAAEITNDYAYALNAIDKNIKPSPDEYAQIREDNPVRLFDLAIEAGKHIPSGSVHEILLGQAVAAKIVYLGQSIGGPDLDAAVEAFREHEAWCERVVGLDRDKLGTDGRISPAGAALAELLLDSPKRALGLELVEQYDYMKKGYMIFARNSLAIPNRELRQQGLRIFERYGEKPPVEITQEERIATAQRDFKSFEGSLRVLEQAMEKLGTDRAKLMSANNDLRYVADRYLTAALQLNKHKLAFETAERLQGRALRDLLGSGLHEKRNRQNSAPRTAASVELTRVVESALDGATPVAHRDLTLQGNLSETQTGAVTPEETEQASHAVAALRVDQIQALLDDDTTLLFVHVSSFHGYPESWGFLGVVSKTTFFLVPETSLLSKLVTLQNLCGSVQNLFQTATSGTWNEQESTQFRHISQELHRHIIEPVQDYLKTKRLVIVPSRELFQIPFGLLMDANGNYLCEQFAVSYAPSASALALCMCETKELGERISVFANPQLPEAGYSLKFAEDEAEAIHALYPKANIRVGHDATESALRTALGECDIIHLACHGMVDEKDPLASFLALSGDETHDGKLASSEILALQTTARLVVLSACKTGRGAVYGAGQELVGMVRAWMIAGAPAVMVSLWKIDDRATSELMGEFYRNLKTMGRAEALQKAQLTMMKKYDNPYYWGAFVLYGDYR